MQAKRIQVNESNDGVGAGTRAAITVPLEPREQVNMHNIWFSVSAEPQDAAANSQGTWVLFTAESTESIPVFTDANVQLENSNNNIIACGVYSASNETPYNFSGHIKTSRNINPGGSLVIELVTTGITAGLSSNRVMLCAHTVRK